MSRANSVNKNFAMSLAELLITLSIIGVVCAYTIPTVINNIQDAQYKVSYKRAFAIANMAFKSVIAQGDTYSALASSTDGVAGYANWQLFSAQFKKAKECINNNNNNQCWYYGSGAEASYGAPYSSGYAFIDNSGVAWSMRNNSSDPSSENADATIFLVDTNGFKKPNKYGKDRFVFKWDLDSRGTPKQISLLYNKDYINGTTDAWVCPTGPCYYKSWLLN